MWNEGSVHVTCAGGLTYKEPRCDESDRQNAQSSEGQARYSLAARVELWLLFPGAIIGIDLRRRVSLFRSEAVDAFLRSHHIARKSVADGKLLYRSEQLRGQPLGPVPTGSADSNRQHAHSLRLPSGMRVRSISRVHRLADGNTVIVRLAVSEEHLWHEFWEMVTVLGVGLPVIVILVALTG